MENLVFMSIKEIYINKILEKTKNHEFRTQIPKNKINYIGVYIPAPIKELKYILKVNTPIVSPNKIIIEGWGNKAFNIETGKKYAYPIESAFEINKPIKLDILKSQFGFTAPQCFAYGKKYPQLLKYIEDVGITKLY